MSAYHFIFWLVRSITLPGWIVVFVVYDFWEVQRIAEDNEIRALA